MADVPATLLVVSHDRRLLDTVCEKLWVVDDGLAAPFDGTYRAWRSAVADGWTVQKAVDQESRRLHRERGIGRPAAAPSGRPAGRPNGRFGGPSDPASAESTAAPVPTAAARPAAAVRAKGKKEKLSKDAYRRQKASAETELTRLGLRKSHLELQLGDPGVAANFVELRRITSELADIDVALAAAEDQWLEIEDRAP